MTVLPLYPPTKFAAARAGIESGEGPRTKERMIFHEGATSKKKSRAHSVKVVSDGCYDSYKLAPAQTSAP